MKIILLLLSAVAAAASLSSCTESAAVQNERPPENGAQFKEGEGLSLTDTMKKSIGLQTAEVTDEEIAPSFAVALHVMQKGDEATGSLTAEQAARVQPGMEIEMREDSPDAAVMKGIVTRIEKSPYAALGDFALSVNGETPLAAGSRLQATFRFPAGDFVRGEDRHNFFHIIVRFERLPFAISLFSDGGDDGPFGAIDDVGFQAHLLDALSHSLNGLFGRSLFHDDDHVSLLGYVIFTENDYKKGS